MAANAPDVALALAAANDFPPRRPPGTVRVIIRPPDDSAVATVRMKTFVQGFGWIAVKCLRDGTPLPAPIDFVGAA
jgi:hypothetical protein